MTFACHGDGNDGHYFLGIGNVFLTFTMNVEANIIRCFKRIPMKNFWKIYFKCIFSWKLFSLSIKTIISRYMLRLNLFKWKWTSIHCLIFISGYEIKWRPMLVINKHIICFSTEIESNWYSIRLINKIEHINDIFVETIKTRALY